MKYEEAISKLEDIVRKMENDEYNIDELSLQLKEAQKLIQLCTDKLTKTEKELAELTEKKK